MLHCHVVVTVQNFMTIFLVGGTNQGICYWKKANFLPLPKSRKCWMVRKHGIFSWCSTTLGMAERISPGTMETDVLARKGHIPFQKKSINTWQSITQHFILYTIKIVYCQGDMFRLLLGHLQALWENRSKSYLYFNELWDSRCLQTVLYECEMHKFVYIGICVAVSALKG